MLPGCATACYEMRGTEVPVTKYRSISEMPSLDDEDAFDLAGVGVRELLTTTKHLSRGKFPPGLWKYRSVAQAWQQRQEWELASTPTEEGT